MFLGKRQGGKRNKQIFERLRSCLVLSIQIKIKASRDHNLELSVTVPADLLSNITSENAYLFS